MIYCPNCGTKIEPLDAKFCRNCGNPINSTAGKAVPPISNAKSVSSQESPKNIKWKQTEPKKILKKIGIVFCVVITVVWIVVELIFYTSPVEVTPFSVAINASLIALFAGAIYGMYSHKLRITMIRCCIVVTGILGVACLVTVVVSMIKVIPDTVSTASTNSSINYIHWAGFQRLGYTKEQIYTTLGTPTSTKDFGSMIQWVYDFSPGEIYAFQNGFVATVSYVATNLSKEEAIQTQNDMIRQLKINSFEYYSTLNGLDQYRSSRIDNLSFSTARVLNPIGKWNVLLQAGSQY